METLLGIAFTLLTLVLLGWMAWRVRRGEPLLSVWNFFIGGFIIFQVTSAATSFLFQSYDKAVPADPGRTGLLYGGMVVIFLVLFGLAYRYRWFNFRIGERLATPYSEPSPKVLMALAFGLIGISYFCRFVLAYVPLILALATILSAALAAASAGCACWSWSRNQRNPVYILLALTIIALAIVCTVYQNFGRRDVTSVMVACLWGAYHGHFKLVSWRRAALPFAIVAAMSLTFVAARTATRSQRALTMSMGEVVRDLRNANLSAGFLDMLGGQYAAANSLWLLENRPTPHPYNLLHSALYAVTQPIPRPIWEAYMDIPKPNALGSTMVPEVGVTRVGAQFNFGPGIIGHIANDNPWFALLLYPIVLAATCRILDDMIARQPNNSFVVIPAGVALGEIVALSRGELGLFYFRTIAAIASTYVAMWLVAKVLAGLGMTVPKEQHGYIEASDGAEIWDAQLAAEYTSERDA